MVVSRDWPEVSVLECILGGLKIGVDVEPEPERARAKLAKSKIDALIVDCDLDGSNTFLRSLESSNVNSVPLVVIGSAGNRSQLKRADAAFIFEKPISVERAVHTLSAARNLILDGRLRYHRQTVDLPATITYGARKQARARLLNLSQGGVAICSDRPNGFKGEIQVGFTLPGSRTRFKAKGEVVWSRQGNSGIRFGEMSTRAKQALRTWLAQQYLTQ